MAMDKRLTRNDAAMILNTSPQTITNWVERGLLGGFSDKKSRRFYVNAEDVEKCAEQYRMLSVSEQTLKDKLNELERSEREVDESLEPLRRQALLIKRTNDKKVNDSLTRLYCSISDMNAKYAGFIKEFLAGESISEIADKRGLSCERIRQIVTHCMGTFGDSVDAFIKNKEEVEKVKKENENLKHNLKVALGMEERKLERRLTPGMLLCHLSDFNLSVRILNVMKTYGIDTLCDLVKHTLDEVSEFKNLGRKSLYELDELVGELGLKWGMEDARAYSRGAQMLSETSHIDTTFYGFLQMRAKDIKERYSLDYIEAMNRAFDEMALFVDRIKDMNESKILQIDNDEREV